MKFQTFPGGVMVAQMILVHLVGVRIPAGERLTTKGFPLGKPFVVYFSLCLRSFYFACPELFTGAFAVDTITDVFLLSPE